MSDSCGLPKRFDGDVVVVTGSTRGIGAEIASRFAEEGAEVVVSGRSTDEGQTVVTGIEQIDGEATFVEADVRNKAAIKTLIETAVDEYGGIDVLVNNAAVQTETSTRSATIEDWNRIVETNFRAYWLGAKYAAEHIPAGGSILNVSSNHAYHTMPQHFPYNAVKSGINGMTRAMALDLGPLGIRVNSISPGWVLVERTEEALTAADRQHLEEIHPIGRLGRPEDIAGVAAWLASEDARFVTGTDIVVDGGRGAVMQDDTVEEYNPE